MQGHIVVTGAAGFIGSHLCDRLLAGGHTVVGVDSFEEYYARELKETNLARARTHPAFTLLEQDLLEADLPAVLEGAAQVYHLAAQPGVRASWGSSFEVYARNNVLATQRVLEACLAAGSPPVVYASSSSVYGDQDELPLREEMVPRPRSPYGVTKLAGEHLCLLYAADHGLPVVALRFFTVYGPRQRPDMVRRGRVATHAERPGRGSAVRDRRELARGVHAAAHWRGAALSRRGHGGARQVWLRASNLAGAGAGVDSGVAECAWMKLAHQDSRVCVGRARERACGTSV